MCVEQLKQRESLKVRLVVRITKKTSKIGTKPARLKISFKK